MITTLMGIIIAMEDIDDYVMMIMILTMTFNDNEDGGVDDVYSYDDRRR